MKEKTAQILLKKVKNDYNDIADEFDLTRSFVGKEFSIFDKFMIPNAKIVDLGCGNGRIVEYLKKIYVNLLKTDFNYIGVDNSENLLNKAKNKYGDTCNIDLIKGDQLDIPLKSKSADMVFSIRAFHHIPSKKLRLKALIEIKRILKADGILIITVWNLFQKKYFKFAFAGILRYLYTFGQFAPNDTFIPWNKKVARYYHAFLPSELINLVKSSGFNIMEFSKGQDLIIIARKKDD
jgi:ubiquinone/menaquinone biosynthesis C-methylase UbiE